MLFFYFLNDICQNTLKVGLDRSGGRVQEGYSIKVFDLLNTFLIFWPGNRLKVFRILFPTTTFWIPDSGLPSGFTTVVVNLNEILHVTLFNKFRVAKNNDSYKMKAGCKTPCTKIATS